MSTTLRPSARPVPRVKPTPTDELLAAALLETARRCLIRAGHHLDQSGLRAAHQRNAATIARLDDTRSAMDRGGLL